jgi:hypothetical protein
MIMCSDKLSTLPIELKRYIYDFSYQHRVNHKDNLNIVLDELLYVTNYTYCDNDMCEEEICKLDSIEHTVLNNVCYFCDDHCKSYGEWSIRYDYKKSRRLERHNI